MKVIDLDEMMSFEKALKNLLEGKCLGIKPKGNSNYIVLYAPEWMNSDYFLCWNNTEGDTNIRSNQYLEEWSLVIINHLTLKKE